MVMYMNEPLANKLKPKNISEVIGQSHLVSEGKIIYNMVKNKKVFSMILYGKPGIGKTSIAYAIGNELDINIRYLNATVNNKKDFDVVVSEAKMYNGLLLIMDEIHRLNKDKQDLLLPQLESGLVTLIGMTTSNPFHSINPAIRSRCHLFELHELDSSDIKEGLLRVVNENILPDLSISDDSLDYIANVSGSDLRYAYNLLELAYYSKDNHVIDLEFLKSIDNKHNFFHDKNDDGYYDVLSAFQKSIRGSDVNASLHYLGRMLKAEDLDSIFRRLTVICYEDIGLANPAAAERAMTAIQATQMVGLPEARIPLANAVIELALSPKSNSAITAIDNALSDIRNKKIDSIPANLKDAHYSGAKKLGHGINYLYPHDYQNDWVAQQYLPDNLTKANYFQPKGNSKVEQRYKAIYQKLKQMQTDDLSKN